MSIYLLLISSFTELKYFLLIEGGKKSELEIFLGFGSLPDLPRCRRRPSTASVKLIYLQGKSEMMIL